MISHIKQTFGIGHLLGLTSAIALMIAWSQLCAYLQYSNSPQSIHPIEQWRDFVWSGVQGSLLASTVWLVSRRSNGERMLTAPGHWLLFLNSLLIPITMVEHTFFSYQLWKFGDELSSGVLVTGGCVYAVFNAVLSYLFVSPTKKFWNDQSKLWSVVFALQVLLSLLWVLFYLANLISLGFNVVYVSPPLMIVMAVAVVFAAGRDLAFNVARDWIHWFSVPVSLCAFLANPLIELFSRLT